MLISANLSNLVIPCVFVGASGIFVDSFAVLLNVELDSGVRLWVRSGEGQNILVLLPGGSHLFAHGNELFDRIN